MRTARVAPDHLNTAVTVGVVGAESAVIVCPELPTVGVPHFDSRCQVAAAGTASTSGRESTRVTELVRAALNVLFLIRGSNTHTLTNDAAGATATVAAATAAGDRVHVVVGVVVPVGVVTAVGLNRTPGTHTVSTVNGLSGVGGAVALCAFKSGGEDIAII